MPRLLFISVIVLGVTATAWYTLQNSNAMSKYFGGTTISGTASFAYQNASEDNLFVTWPSPGASVTSTILVKGFARGTWYSEAVFPVSVENEDGMEIGQAQGRAQADWTTTAFVPFGVEIDLKTPYTGVARVILKKDNPSGDPTRDASVSFPVVIQ